MIGNYFWGGAAAAPYEIEQSLRFRGSQWLSRTPGSNGNRQTYTHSVWIKKEGVTGTLASAGSNTIFSTQQQSTQERFRTGNSETTGLAQIWNAGGKYISGLGRYTDPAGWYHLVAVFDSTEASSGDRLKIYLNGKLLSTQSNATISLNANWTWNSTLVHHIGKLNTNDGTSAWDTDFAKFYMAEYHMVDGSALDPTDFGEFDDNGVWRPIEVTGLTYGTNGFYLKFDPSATNGIGHDHSGNGNNWTASGFTTSGTGTDVMSDTPTNNFPTLNPLYTTPPYPTQNQSGTLSEGNLAITFNGVDGGRGVTFAEVPTSGKWYFEAKQTSADNTNISLGFFGNYTANFNNAWRIIHTNGGGGFIYSFQGPESGSEPSGSVSYSSGNVLGIEIDMDNSTLQYHVNGTYATKATGLSFASYAPLLMDFRRQNSSGTNNSWLFNFGQRAFEYTPTSGFNALCTANLPAPDIADGSDYFATDLWTGNDATRDITVADSQGNTWAPDLVWIKMRNSTMSHYLYDTVRGATKSISSDSTRAETTDVGRLTAFNTDGFELGSSSRVNSSPNTYVGWSWLAGNGTSSISTGSIDGTNPTIASTVSANPSAGFSIVSYNAGLTSSGTRTVGHGLGVPPKLIIGKTRSSGAWRIRPFFLNNNAYDFLEFDTGALAQLSSSDGTMSLPTNTTFDVNWNTSVGASGDIIAYCFAEVEGYSKFGKYTGNNSSDGPFVYCGFRPALVLAKSSTLAGTPWWIIDSTRSPYNLADESLRPYHTTNEQTGQEAIDFLSNGFKIRTTDSAANWAYEYVYMAFAENPFGGDGVSPATAR